MGFIFSQLMNINCKNKKKSYHEKKCYAFVTESNSEYN